MPQVLTRPQGGGGIPGTSVQDVNIPGTGAAPANIVDVDSVDYTNNSAVKWIYTLTHSTNDKVITGEVSAMHRSGASPSHNRRGLVGDLIPHFVDVKISGPNLVLEITNNQVDSLTASVVRVQTLA